MKPILIAHRGASGYLPEHTLPAVVAAHVMGADYIEQDIVLSRDGIPLVLHDIYLETTTDVAVKFPGRNRSDGRFYAIDFDLDEIKSLSVHERVDGSGTAVFGSRFPVVDMALRIPTLAEEITLINGLNHSRSRSAGYYIELKAPALHRAAGLDIATITLELLEGAGLNTPNAPAFLQCFDPATLRQLKTELATPLPLIQLIADNAWGEVPGIDFQAMQSDRGLVEIADYADGIGPWIPQLFEPDGTTPGELVQNAHHHGLLVHTYTLRADNLEAGFQTFDALQEGVFIRAGVDGAFSDFSDLTRRFIDGMDR